MSHREEIVRKIMGWMIRVHKEEKFLNMKNTIMEIMVEFNTTRRTAAEYFRTAKMRFNRMEEMNALSFID